MKFNFETLIYKNFENRTKNTKDIEGNMKIAKYVLKSSSTAMDVSLRMTRYLILISLSEKILKI